MKILKNEALPFAELKRNETTGYSMRKHSHSEFSIGTILRGATENTIEDEAFHLGRGDIILIPSHKAHICEPDKNNPFDFFMLYLSEKWLYERFPFLPGPVKTQKLTPDTEAFNIWVDYLENFTSPLNSGSDAESRLIQHVYPLMDPVTNRVVIDKSEAVIRVIDYIKEHFTDKITLEDLAEAGHMAPESLLRLFKKETEMTPLAYINNRRINLAREMLNRNHTLLQITADCGFFDQSHFIRQFKLYFGMTPGQYRNDVH